MRRPRRFSRIYALRWLGDKGLQVTYETVADQLVERVPELDSSVRSHRNSYGEVLPHVFFGDLIRLSGDLVRGPKRAKLPYKDAPDTLRRILEFIEEAAASEDRRVVELVQVSFLENLHQLGPESWAITKRLGPRCRHLLRAVEAG